MSTCTRLATLCAAMAYSTWSTASEPRAESQFRETYLAEIQQELTHQWPHNRMVVVVCHGHSVPTGYFRAGEVRPLDSYPHLLQEAVQQKFPKCVFEVIRTGIGGEQSEQGAKRFTADVLQKRPEVVTIDYALNDRAIGLERAKAAWTTMIEQSLAAQVKVILLTPSPDTNADLDDPLDPLNAHAAQIRELAMRHQVGLVDSLAAFEREAVGGTPLPTLMSQPNHPNRRGHELIVRELAPWFGVPAK